MVTHGLHDEVPSHKANVHLLFKHTMHGEESDVNRAASDGEAQIGGTLNSIARDWPSEISG